MRAPAMPVILLVKAVEEADATHALLPLADREHATRETLRALGLQTAEADFAADARRYMRALAERARRLAENLGQRYPVIPELLAHLRWPAWLSVLLVLTAFAIGAVLASVQEPRRINILAFPFLGVIAWNLLVYLVLLLAWLRSAARRTGSAVKPVRGRALSAVVTRILSRPLNALARRTAGVHTVLGRAVQTFIGEWSRYAAPAIAAHSRRLLHLGSAAIALGLIAGLYFRGIVFRYEAGWESTFLGPSQVLNVIAAVFGPAARWSGVALPSSTDAVAALRWDGAGGGGDAAPWIHLIAVTLAIYVVIPRFVLAAADWTGELRLRFGTRLPAALETYTRRVFGAPGRGLRKANVTVTPYAYEPPSGTLAALERLLAVRLGGAVQLAMQPLVHYGEEALASRTAAAGGQPPADAQVLLFSLGATPETENHGLIVSVTRDAVHRTHPAAELLVVIDEAPYAARLGADESYERRLDERRDLWRRFLASYGLEATLLDAEEPA